MSVVEDVVTTYCEGGNLDDYERMQAKHALYQANEAEPEHAYRIALRFLDAMLTRAERDAGIERKRRW